MFYIHLVFNCLEEKGREKAQTRFLHWVLHSTSNSSIELCTKSIGQFRVAHKMKTLFMSNDIGRLDLPLFYNMSKQFLAPGGLMLPLMLPLILPLNFTKSERKVHFGHYFSK